MGHQIRTSLQPDVLLDVDDAEYTDLTRQGLVIKDDAEDGTTEEDSKANTTLDEGGQSLDPNPVDAGAAKSGTSGKPAKPTTETV